MAGFSQGVTSSRGAGIWQSHWRQVIEKGIQLPQRVMIEIIYVHLHLLLLQVRSEEHVSTPSKRGTAWALALFVLNSQQVEMEANKLRYRYPPCEQPNVPVTRDTVYLLN